MTQPLAKLPKKQQEMLDKEFFDKRNTFYIVMYGNNDDVLFIDEDGFGWVRDLDDVKQIDYIMEVVV